MPPLLQSAQLKPDVTITSADSENEAEDSDDERFSTILYTSSDCSDASVPALLVRIPLHENYFNLFKNGMSNLCMLLKLQLPLNCFLFFAMRYLLF